MRRGLFFMLAAPGAALLIFFFLVPLAAVSMDGFTDGGSAFVRVLRNDLFWGGLRGSLVLASTASVFSLIICRAALWSVPGSAPQAPCVPSA